jgi:hypothetical protein
MLGDFLGIDHEIEYYEKEDYELCVGEGKTIIVKDSFFNHFPEPLSYLKTEHIPESISFSENQFTSEKNIPILLGTDEFEFQNTGIVCGIDLFAASFFMLTRWEEHVIKERDPHGRVPDSLHYAVKYGISERPIVNEYAQMLKQMIRYLGVEISDQHVYKPVLTHDVDFFLRYDTGFKMLKAVAGDILKRKSVKDAVRTIRDCFKIKKGKLNDPYDTFDWLMQQSESVGLKSIFYFIPSLPGEPDAQYSILDETLIDTIKKISRKGHTVGVHGAYRSYTQAELFQEELGRFPKGITIEENRQHYLRFDVPETFDMLDALGIKIDSSIGYTEKVGFRAGTCYEYPLFHIMNRKQLSLIERPLIVMDQAIKKQVPDSDSVYEKILELEETVQKYSGTFVLLWHNTNFNTKEWRRYSDLYKRLIKKL